MWKRTSTHTRKHIEYIVKTFKKNTSAEEKSCQEQLTPTGLLQAQLLELK